MCFYNLISKTATISNLSESTITIEKNILDMQHYDYCSPRTYPCLLDKIYIFFGGGGGICGRNKGFYV